MRATTLRLFLAAAAFAVFAGSAMADFSGQPILGPLGPGSSVSGDLTGASDDNDGWFSGFPIFGIWDGGDDVWQLNWPGGDMTIDLIYDNFLGDPDLFLYTPSNLDESALDSYANTGLDSVTLPSAAAGTYYVLVDTTAANEGPYLLNATLTVPEPSTLGLCALGFAAILCRAFFKR